MRADTWDASVHTLPEWQCRPHPADYGTRGPANIRVWKEVDPITNRVVAYRTHVQWQAQQRTIWMDGRPHPPEDAPHTWQGFSTGRWVGNSLEVTTTHLKESYLRRNGVPRSDRATLYEQWTRHGNVLTLFSMIVDPVYLTEPMVRSTNWEMAPRQNIEPYPCEVGDEISREAGVIPHHLPGANPYLADFARKEGLPEVAARGGAHTAYPEFMAVLRGRVPAPAASAPSFPADAVASATSVATGVRTQKVQGNVFMISTPRANVTVQVGDEGLIVVDAGPAALTAQILAELRKLSSRPVRYVVNTDLHEEHTGGNRTLFEEGETIAGGDVVNLVGDSSRSGAIIIGHENTLTRMTIPASGGTADRPFGSYPTDIYIGTKKDLFMNGEGVRIAHLPGAHTDGQSVVFFRKSDVISAGDVFVTTGYPRIGVNEGGTIQGEIDALNALLDMAIPAAKAEGGTFVVPGQGRLSDMADVAYYRDMVTIIRDRVRDMKRRGMTLDQVKAARPTRDYDARWGASSGPWTTDMFVEAVYQTVDISPRAASR